MDSLTQVVLGASVAAVCVPSAHRRQAIVAGAILGTLPDLDVLIDYGDDVSNFTYHRGFTHSWFMLLPFALGVWLLLRRFWEPVKQAPKPWFYAITLALMTHPMLDAHTVYGTQLFWPIPLPPEMWSTVFIIDPLYTLPLLIAVVFALIKPKQAVSTKALVTGLVLSSLYLGWTWTAKSIAERQAIAALDKKVAPDQVLSTPTPFNSLLWRIVVLEDDHYLEGYYAIHDDKPVEFVMHKRNTDLIEQARGIESVDRLAWFTRGFMKADIVDQQLVISDIRMGFQGKYVFTHAVARPSNNLDQTIWAPIQSTQLQTRYGAEDLRFVWDRLGF